MHGRGLKFFLPLQVPILNLLLIFSAQYPNRDCKKAPAVEHLEIKPKEETFLLPKRYAKHPRHLHMAVSPPRGGYIARYLKASSSHVINYV